MKSTNQVLAEISDIPIEEWREKIMLSREAIVEAMEVYLELKKLILKGDSLLFRWMFLSFYGRNGKLKRNKKEKFFHYFNKEMPASIENVRRIVNDINGDADSGLYYSFVTKMLNMRNEEFYPIYDSKIAEKLFGCNLKAEIDLDTKEECYRRIKEVYDSVDNSFAALQAFRHVFPEYVDKFGKMRLLDFILYNTIPL